MNEDREGFFLLRRRTLDGDAYRPYKRGCPPQLRQVAIKLVLNGIGSGHMSHLRAS